MKVLVIQACPTFCNPLDCSPPGSSVYGILQARILKNSEVKWSSVAQSCPTLCKPMDCSMPDLPVHHQLPEFTHTHVHWVGDAIQPFHLLPYPSPPAFNLSYCRSFPLQWVSIPFSRESSRPRDWTWISCIADRFFTIWATREIQFLKSLLLLLSRLSRFGLCATP